MSAIKLNNFPKEKEFEEYISATFQCCGLYVERNIINRYQKTDILELDMVITNYNKEYPENRLVEVKSRNCKFSDIFKVNGWMNYLKFDRGMFISSEKLDFPENYEKICDSLNIDLISYPELEKCNEKIAKIFSCETINKCDLDVWRYAFWTERELLRKLKESSRTHKDIKCYHYLKHYYYKLNNETFFIGNPLEKLSNLYKLFKKCPSISAKCGNEMIGNNFDRQYSILPNSIFRETFYDCNLNRVQYSTYIEMRSKLSILKAVIDFKFYLENNELSNNMKDRFKIPENIYNIINLLDEHEYYYRYPIMWQWFTWVFGGFFLKDFKEEELKLLSEKAKIPIDEIENAFNFYDELFPTNNGWMSDLSKQSYSGIETLKFFPIPLKGIGSHYRKVLHNIHISDPNNFKDFNTNRDLTKWNNMVYNILYNSK